MERGHFRIGAGRSVTFPETVVVPLFELGFIWPQSLGLQRGPFYPWMPVCE